MDEKKDGRFHNDRMFRWEWWWDGKLVAWAADEIVYSSPFNGDIDKFERVARSYGKVF